MGRATFRVQHRFKFNATVVQEIENSGHIKAASNNNCFEKAKLALCVVLG